MMPHGLPRPRVSPVRRAAALLLAVILGACASADFKKGCEVVLQTAPTAYDTAMTFARENKASLPLETLQKFELVRVQFPPAYRAFDSAYATWVKSGAKEPGDVVALRDEVDRLISQLQALLFLNGGPDLRAKK